MKQTQEKQANWKNRCQIFSGAQLKYIAFLSMLIDHVNKGLIYPYLNGGIMYSISNLFDVIGRIAFPIFVFLLVEGYFHTKNKWKYLGTLLLFGIISEVPFDMFTTRTFYEVNWNNMMFTLAMVLVTIWIIDVCREKMNRLPRIFWYLLSFCILLIACFLAMNLGVDYEHHAILVGYFFYLFHERRILAIPFGYLSVWKEPWALLGFGLTLTYNGERGKQSKLFNYLFYPVHLFILGLLRFVLGI